MAAVQPRFRSALRKGASTAGAKKGESGRKKARLFGARRIPGIMECQVGGEIGIKVTREMAVPAMSKDETRFSLLFSSAAFLFFPFSPKEEGSRCIVSPASVERDDDVSRSGNNVEMEG